MKIIFRLIAINIIVPLIFLCFSSDYFSSFQVSKDLKQSKINGVFKSIYIPDKYSYKLLDNTTVKIDTAWAETMWCKDVKGNIVKIEKDGYNLVVPINKTMYNSFTFDFRLEDKANQAFTNGIENDRCVLNPKYLKDSIILIIDEKNPDTAYGWMKPISAFRIKLVKVK
jgi:hypothetical protein